MLRGTAKGNIVTMCGIHSCTAGGWLSILRLWWLGRLIGIDSTCMTEWELGKSLGLRWEVTSRLEDRPHFELSGYEVSS